MWVSDITYIWTKEGWLYLASMMDLYSRRIIGWETRSRMTKELVITALERTAAAQKPQPVLIHHSDRGSQYASKDYQLLLRKHRIVMSRKGNCYDNACIESFHSIIKKELVFHHRYRTRQEAASSIFEYIVSFYNFKRIHSANQYMAPIAYEKLFYSSRGKENPTFCPA